MLLLLLLFFPPLYKVHHHHHYPLLLHLHRVSMGREYGPFSLCLAKADSEIYSACSDIYLLLLLLLYSNLKRDPQFSSFQSKAKEEEEEEETPLGPSK